MGRDHRPYVVLASSSQATMAESRFFSPMLIGVIAVFGFLIVRTTCVFLLWHVPAGTHEPRETTSLLAQSHAAKHLSRSARFFCALGALVYICLTMLAAFHAFLEHGQSAIQDVRFAIFRAERRRTRCFCSFGPHSMRDTMRGRKCARTRCRSSCCPGLWCSSKLLLPPVSCSLRWTGWWHRQSGVQYSLRACML
ncbi:hypothetical protein B0H17DRAFT_1098146, partial [Mycena rosella]